MNACAPTAASATARTIDAPCVAVAASGGRDSTALLHCTVRAAAALGIRVVALHVHHGLSAHADAWLAQVRRQARRWGAGFDCRRLDGAPAPGDSVEAWARSARYRALAEMATGTGCSLVLLAHHRQDQAETWLLQALRSGGPAGLSAMPAVVERNGLTWARPWLDQPRAAVDAYVRARRLTHVDDDSNADPRWARNRLRLQVWPSLLAAFADAETALAGAARQAQHAATLAREVAAADLPAALQDTALAVAPWLALPPARRRNALQAWLAQALPGAGPASLLDRLIAELPACQIGRWPVAGAELRLYRGLLRADAPLPSGTAQQQPAAHALDLSHPGAVALASWQGRFHVQPALQGGAAPHLLRQVVPRARRGGEQFRLEPRAAARSLKKQYQARGIPAWQRLGPLLFMPDGRLMFVPGLGIDAALHAPPGQPQLQLIWQADQPR